MDKTIKYLASSILAATMMAGNAYSGDFIESQNDLIQRMARFGSNPKMDSLELNTLPTPKGIGRVLKNPFEKIEFQRGGSTIIAGEIHPKTITPHGGNYMRLESQKLESGLTRFTIGYKGANSKTSSLCEITYKNIKEHFNPDTDSLACKVGAVDTMRVSSQFGDFFPTYLGGQTLIHKPGDGYAPNILGDKLKKMSKSMR